MSENTKSFAERYASKKSSFTSQSLQKPDPVEQKSADVKQDSSESKSNSKIDIKKKMQADLIYLVKGVDAGRNAWYYVLVDRLKVQPFLKALNDDIIHLENYGKILYSAYGDEPPEDITKALKEEYGI
ncbi:MAG: hypothetical protein KGQ36_05515 [Rickettsiales bacterium]|nr:hypothetical protein [Rickettsiales bacterium]